MPKGFKTIGSELEWDEAKQTYTYQGKAVDYRNMYVIEGKLGVFTNFDGSEVYTGTVYGKHNEILMTVKDNGKFYSYWAASVTDPSVTMETYPVSKYNSDLAVIDKNIKDLNKDIIKEVTLTKGDDSAIIRLVRNGGNAVDGAITVTSGGGTDGSGAAHDTFVKISNGTTEQTFATGSKVEAIVDNGATTGIKINGEDYTIKSGSKVSVTQNADEKTTTITVDGKATTITDTDTTYTAGDGIAIDKTNKNAISVKLKEGENNLEVTEAGLELKKDLTVNSVKAGEFYMSTAGIGYDDKAYITSSGLNANSQKITGVADGTETKDAVNFGQLQETNTKVENLKVEAGKHTTLVNGENTTVELVGDGIDGKQYKVNVDLSQYAKTEDVAVVYVDNNKNKSLHTTNSGAVESNAIALGKDASAVKDGGVALGNEAYAGNKGTSLGTKAKSGREGATVVGYNTNSSGLYSTVVGTDAVINTDGTAYQTPFKDVIVQGAAATVVGSKNTVDNKNKKVYSGVANNVMGAANTIEASNGVTIQGTGNKVTDAYKDMNINPNEGLAILGGDYSVLAKKPSGAIAVVGGANTVSKQTDSTVIGYDNRLIGGDENISHDVFMAGSHNRLDNVSDSIVMGNKNTINGVSNVISFGHDNKIKASNAVAIGNGAGVSVKGGVALGVGSVASTDANALGYGAAEGETGIAWKATNGAVSVGSSVEGKKITRQITNVAAGTEDTDAVNVAQLKKVSEAAASASQGWKLKTKKGNASDVKPGDEVEFDGDANIQVGNDGNKVSVTLKKQLTGIQSITGAGEGAGSISFANGGKVKVNDVIIEKGGKITGVADGKISADSKEAVNGSQLNAVKETANKGWNLSTNGDEASTKVAPGETVDFSGDKNISVSHDGTNVKVELNDELKDIKSISNGNKTISLDGTALLLKNGDATLAIAKGAAGMQNGAGASVVLNGTQTVINGGVTFDHTGKITNVKAGESDTDAVNVSQLNAVKETANKGWNLSTNGGEASKVAPDATVDFSGDKNISVSHDGTKVQVKLNENIDVNSIKTNALNSKYNLSVGTMAENGIMPFLVSSTGAFYAANNNFSVDKDGKVIATAGEIGNVVLQNGVHTGNSALRDGELYLGDASGNYSQITPKSAKLGQVTIDEKGNMAGVNSIQTNALNAKYNLSVGTMAENGIMPFLVSSTGAFYAANNNFSVDKDGKVIATAGEIGNVVLQNGVYTGNSALRDGELYVGDASGNYSQITTTGAKLGQVTIAADGKISGVAAGEVSKTSTDAINGSQLNQTNENVAALDKRVTQNEADIAQNKADIAQNKADIAQNKADIAQNKADIAQNKADIAQNKADIATNKQNIDKLNTRVDGVEKLAKQHTTVTAGDNIAVTETTNKDGGKEYNVALKNIIDLGDKGSVTTGQTEMNKDGLKVGDKVSVTATAVTAGKTSISDEGVKVGDKVSVSATAVTAGKTSISDEGVKVGDKTYISADGLNANGQHITNVKAGEADTDAVNYGQLKDTNNRINQLGSRVNKVGAGAAALAALHPMDFDPDDKLTFSAGYGNYGGENAAAIGAYYRPDEKVMFSVAGTVGNGENMVNAGVSFALDRTNHVSNSRTALAREVIDLRGQLAVMGAKMAKMEKAFGMLDETKTKLFPDVPANHWAYEYIAKLAGNGYIEGYPDGNFGGDRLMTRYEFAAMLYRAIEKGAALEEKIIKEFEPELGRIRVDRISGEDGDRDKIERVRVNDTKGERDHYGNKLAK